MMKFPCNLNVFVRLRQFNILSRGLGSKEILTSEWMQPRNFSDGCVKICDGSFNSKAVSKLHFQKTKGIPSASSSLIIENECGIKRERRPKSCSRHNIFPCSNVFTSRLIATIDQCHTNQQRLYSTSKFSKVLNIDVYFLNIMKNNNDFARNFVPFPLSLFLKPINEFKAWEVRLTIDPEFRTKSFLKGAETAIMYVSGAIAESRFDDLEGLVEDETRSIIELNCKNMSEQRKQMIAVVKNQMYPPTLGDIKIIRREKGKVTLEASVVAAYLNESLPDYEQMDNFMEFSKKMKFGVYIFRKDVYETAGAGNWMIHKLEHIAMKPLQSNQ